MGKPFLKDIKKLASYIKNLKDFKFYNGEEFKKEFFYHDHMGAIIADGILQQGLKWEDVVKPRLKELVKIKKAETTTGFYNFYNKKGLEILIDFKNKRKIKAIKCIVDLLIKEKVETPINLNKWLRQDENIEKLKNIYGVGDKTTDYFKILAEIPNSAVDRHLMNFLRKAKIEVKTYTEAHRIINKTADSSKRNKSLFDYSIWKYMSSIDKRRKKTCKSKSANRKSKIIKI